MARAEQNVVPGATPFSKAVARYGFKLMAYKDEYKVARLHIAAVPERIRGYGYIKGRHSAEVKPHEAELLVAF